MMRKIKKGEKLNLSSENGGSTDRNSKWNSDRNSWRYMIPSTTSTKFPHRKAVTSLIKIPVRKADGVRIPILKAIYLTYPGCLLKIMAGSTCDIFFSQYQLFSCSASHVYINICQEFLSVLEETIFLRNESCVPTYKDDKILGWATLPILMPSSS